MTRRTVPIAEPEPEQPVTFDDLGIGLSIPRELASDPAAILAVIEHARCSVEVQEQAALDALPPIRRAHKRQAMRQRREREARSVQRK